MKRLKPSLSSIVYITSLIVALGLGSQMRSIDSDLGRHLALGNYILDARVVPTHDLLSNARAGFSRPPYEWLSQVIFALSNRLLGLDGVILFTSIIIALTFALIFQFTNRRSGSTITSLVIVFLAVGASTIHWLPRPHIISLLLLAIWVDQLDQLTEGNPVRLYFFPLIMLFWVNLHGGFIFGILAWFAYFAGWAWNTLRGKVNKRIGINLLITGATSIIATIITPDLWHNWDAVLNNRSAFILNRTVETMRPNLIDPSVLPFTLLLLLTFFLSVLNRKTLKPGRAFLLMGFGLMSLLMTRNIPLFVIACIPFMIEMATKSLSGFKVWIQIEEQFSGFVSNPGTSLWYVVATFFAIAYVTYFNFINNRSIYQFDPSVFPVEAVNFLEANPQSGNMFNEFNWGGYLEYRLWPRYTVFLDSQSDFYGESLIRDYDQIMSARDGWQTLLETYQVDWVIVKNDNPVATALQSELNWRIIYQDATATIIHKP